MKDLSFTAILDQIDGVVWGVPMIILIMGTGILLTIRLKVMQFGKLGLALKYMVKNESDGVGEVTSFGALCTGSCGHHRYRKYRRCCNSCSCRRSRRPFLDDSGGVLRNGY